jgi:aspartate carbamoyltransferase catalytic subunit
MSNKNNFHGKSFITTDGITRSDLNYLFKKADLIKDKILAKKSHEVLKGRSIAILFYQPSTRTFSSFVAAAQRLGAYVTAIQGMQEYSSVTKGETLPDTIRSIHQTTAADVIVLRHPSDKSGKTSVKFSSVPIISGGSGTEEHPTQALLDLYTIKTFHGTINNLKVALVGDLLYGRTTKSLAKSLAKLGRGNELALVSPPEMQMPEKIVKTLKKGAKITKHQSLDEVLEWADVIYETRVQKEWFAQNNRLDDYETLKNAMAMTKEMAGKMKKDAIIMHPLPRTVELRYGVDKNPRAKYFEQMRMGLYVRMALLEAILIKD